MNKGLRVILFLLVDFSGFHVSEAQVGSETEQSIERITEQSGDAEPQDDSFLQEMSFLAKNPVNLNAADESLLHSIPYLSDWQIRSLLSYRSAFGNFVDIYELQAIPGWSPVLIRKILPYLTLQEPAVFKDLIKERFNQGNHTFLMRYSRVLELSKGFKRDTGQSAPGYLGNPDKWMVRYGYQFKNLLQFGALGEKDPGEPFLRANNKQGFDFYSVHLFVRKWGIIKALALGDFTVNMGQGLIEWQGLAFGKGGDITAIKRQSDLLKPYRSPGEFNFHRGIGLTIGRNNWSFTGFVSKRKQDANMQVSDSTGNSGVSFTSIISSGLHRTPGELADRGVVNQLSIGLNVKRKWRNGHTGFNYVMYRFSHPMRKSDEPYNLYAMSGNLWRNLGFDFAYTYRQVHVFGELATSQSGGKALVAGCLLSVAGQTDISILYRNISPRYHSLNGSAFTERSNPGNERGLYLAMSVRPAYRWELSVYTDWFAFPWIQYGVHAPSAGREYGIKAVVKPSRNNEIYMRVRYELKGSNQQFPGDPVLTVTEKSRVNWRLHASCRLDNRLSIRSRLELTRVKTLFQPSRSGILLYTDLFYKPLLSPVTANLRLQYTETDDYDSRIYAYENDVLYQASVPAFSGQLGKAYINIEYNISKSFVFWLKCSRIFFPNKILIGSGLDEISGNRRTELRIQCLYRF